jgi:GDP-D-mannose 3', 5'-epimerase
MKRALVCGAGGFIGGHLVTKLKNEGYYVVGVDIKKHEYHESDADVFYQFDLKNMYNCKSLFEEHSYHEVYQLAADMGGAGYIFTGEHDADIMHNSAQINLNMVDLCYKYNVGKLFYSSSACMYPAYNQEDPDNPNCAEASAYPAQPDSEYGWEKLFSERLYLAYARNYGLNIRIARFHNIFGPLGSWNNGKEKAPAAMCRKAAMAKDGDIIEIWGDGNQTRSFLYIDECLEGVRRLMNSDFTGPVNIGSEEMVTINQLVEMAIDISGKQNITVTHVTGPTGVRGRNSSNALIQSKLNWAPNYPLRKGMEVTYSWIESQVKKG